MLSLDTETTGLDHEHGTRAFYVTTCTGDGDITSYDWDVDPKTRQVQVVRSDFLEVMDRVEAADEVCLQNAKFDVRALSKTAEDLKLPFRWPWHKTFDTLIAGHLLYSNHKHDLTSMALEYLDHDIQPLEDATEREVKKARMWARFGEKAGRGKFATARKGRRDMPSVGASGGKVWKADLWLPKALAMVRYNQGESEFGPPGRTLTIDGVVEQLPVHPWWTVLSDYANADSEATVYLALRQKELIRELGLTKIFLEMMKLVPIVYGMECQGVTYSAKWVEELTEKYRRDSGERSTECVALAASVGYKLDMPASGRNKSLDNFFFTKEGLDLPVIKKTKKGNPSVASGALTTYAVTLPEGSTGHKFVTALSTKRSRDTAVSYLDGYSRFGVRALPEEKDKPCPQCRRRLTSRGICPRRGCGYVMPYRDWYRLYSTQNLTGTHTLRLSSQNPNAQNVCFDGETEVLTRSGWVRIDELEEGVEIAQFWRGGYSIDFAIPEIHKPLFVGDMLHITTHNSIDMLLTPKHRCLMMSRKFKRWKELTADQFSNDYQHFHAGKYIGGSMSLTSSEVVWLCAVQADGSYTHDKGGSYGISFGVKKPRKVQRLRNCLLEMGTSFTEGVKNGVHRFYIGKSTKANELARRLMPDKKFGPWVLDLDYESLSAMSKEVFLWDGDSTRVSNYTSSHKENADWVQVMFSLTGSKAVVRRYTPASDWAVNDHYVVNVTKDSKTTLTTNFSAEKVPWNGTVYCVTVPSSYVLIRRNGKVSVTGNSKRGESNLRYCYGPEPGREWWTCDYENLELKIPAYKAPERVMINLFEKPDRPPYFGSYHALVCHVLHQEMFEECLNEDNVMDGRIFKDRYADTWYQWVKNGNFAVQYGAQETSGTADRAYHVDGAQAIIASRFTNIKRLNQEKMDMARRLGYVETEPDRTVDPARGYPIYCTLTESGGILPTVPLSYYVQSTAMWCTRKAMIRCHEVLTRWTEETGLPHFMTLQVHDELAFDLPAMPPKSPGHPPGNLHKVLTLRKLMERSGDDIGVPLSVSLSYHPVRWSEKCKFVMAL